MKLTAHLNLGPTSRMRKVLPLLPNIFRHTFLNQRYGNGIPFSRQFLYRRYIELQFQKEGIQRADDVDMLSEGLYTSHFLQSAYLLSNSV
jgi:hypothetical protein